MLLIYMAGHGQKCHNDAFFTTTIEQPKMQKIYRNIHKTYLVLSRTLEVIPVELLNQTSSTKLINKASGGIKTKQSKASQFVVSRKIERLRNVYFASPRQLKLSLADIRLRAANLWKEDMPRLIN